MPDLPAIRPEDVSPNSPLRLGRMTTFVVATRKPDGVHIRSQHYNARTARMARRREFYADADVQVYYVERAEGGE